MVQSGCGPDFVAPAAAYAAIYRQIVVTLQGAAAFPALRDQFYGLLVERGVAYEPRGEIPEVQMVAVELAEDADVEAILVGLRAQALVAAAEQNSPLRLGQVAPVNDPLYWDQWALRRISAEAAWAAAGPAPSVIVGIVDTGISTAHPDLAGHLWSDAAGNHGFNVIAGNHQVEDLDGHGTLLAGTVGAISNNGVGIAGTEWPIRLMALKFHDERTPPSAWLAALAIVWGVVRGARVINAAWDLGLPRQFLRPVIDFVGGPLFGAVFVAGAGNDGLDNDVMPTYPASYNLPNVVSVMASDEYDDRPGFSNYGPTTVHLAAPGVRVLSTHSYLATPQWRKYSGTSPACAHVASAAALVKALHPGWTPAQIRARLVATVDPSPHLRCVARGRLNLAQAI
jgi:subtilisin family serine protease